MLGVKVPAHDPPPAFAPLGAADPVDTARRQLLLGLMLVGLGASALAYVTQLPHVDPLDSVALPLLFVALSFALAETLRGRLNAERGTWVAYVMLATYMLVSLNYQLIFVSPRTHGLSEATYWFAVVYCTAFIARDGRMAARMAALTFGLSLLSGVVNLTYMALHGGVNDRLFGFMGQFYAAGLAAILLLVHITSLRERYGEVRRAAQHDGLTGLANRVHGEELLEAACAGGLGLSLVLFDLDHFKRVNDSFGHAAGDEALRAAARCALEYLPPQAHGARWGGEEFALIVPGATQPQARHLAEQIRAQVASLHRQGSLPRLSASFGVVTRRPGERPADLLRRADAALYCAKDRGRNRVCGEGDPGLA